MHETEISLGQQDARQKGGVQRATILGHSDEPKCGEKISESVKVVQAWHRLHAYHWVFFSYDYALTTGLDVWSDFSESRTRKQGEQNALVKGAGGRPRGDSLCLTKGLNSNSRMYPASQMSRAES